LLSIFLLHSLVRYVLPTHVICSLQGIVASWTYLGFNWSQVSVPWADCSVHLCLPRMSIGCRSVFSCGTRD